MKKYLLALLWIFTLCTTVAQAAITVALKNNGDTHTIPILIASLGGTNGAQVSDIISQDLTRTGQFQVYRLNSTTIDDNSVNIPYALTGNVLNATLSAFSSASNTAESAQVKLQEQGTNTLLIDAQFNAENMRQLAHHIADQIYFKLTGTPGTFSTKIAYTVGNQLIVADADGFNPMVLVNGHAPIISPAWSPDGQSIAYTGFDLGKPVVYIVNVATKQIRTVANYPGNNSAPAWSPDGQQLAVALSKQGLSDIFIINPWEPSTPRLVAGSTEIDTEPYFFPNNSGLVFTSDRGGSPQIYRTGLNGGVASRLTFTGQQNVHPVISPNGVKLAYSSLRNGNYVIAVQNLGALDDTAITNGPNDLSPSFSGNNLQLMYITNGHLAVVNVDGSKISDIQSPDHVSSVAWGPILHKGQ